MATNLEPKLIGAVPQLSSRNCDTGLYYRLLGSWWIAFLASALFVVSGHLLLKAGLNNIVAASSATGQSSPMLAGLLEPQLLGGLLIYSLGTVCWMRAVSLKEISFLYPLSSMNYVLVAAASAVLFHEVISARRAAGIVIIVVGMALMNRQSSGGSSR